MRAFPIPRLRDVVVVFACLLVSAVSVRAQVCANPGKDGPGGTLSGVINTYYPGTANASAGATSISIGTSTGSSTAIATGDLLLVIQMQDAAINSTNTDSYGDGVAGDPASGFTNLNNAGGYEYVVATGPAGGTVSIRGSGGGNGLLNNYTNANASGTQGQRRFQVVRVPQYSSATLSSALTVVRWNGRTGGILVLDVAGVLDLGGATVSVDGMGFRGGGTRQLVGGTGGSNTDYRNVATNGFHGGKAEGMAGTPRYVYDSVTATVLNTGVEGYPNGTTARGAPGNAGGGGTDGNPAANNQNSGGGGGGNGGTGGQGGRTWNSNLDLGGHGGAVFPGAADRVVLGGGGGGGSRNNNGSNSSGSAGGGIVLIRAGTFSGSGAISADGANGNTAGPDGGGGGGAGGSVIIVANTGGLGSLTISARGGRGGDAWPLQAPGGFPGERHGPGGGGGGGFIAVTSGVGTDVSGGANGITTTASDVYGATSGSTGSVLAITPGSVPGAGSGAQCVPVLTTTKSTSTPSVDNTATGTTATYTILVSNAANRTAATNLTASDTLPANFTYNATVVVTLNGGSTRPATTNPTLGDAVPVWGTFTIPGGGSVSITFTVRVEAIVPGGLYQNPALITYLDPARTTVPGTTTSNYDPASSVAEDVTVIGVPQVDLVKSVNPNSPQPPEADLTYTIAFTNNGARFATNLIVVDPIPVNTDFKVGSVTSGLGTTGLTVVVEYSNDSGASWVYTPVSGGGGAPVDYDRTVTDVRWTLTGSLSQTSPDNTGSLGFTVRIR
jgi:uncharacterized repeat protein (TIGR01451 family)/fimbrial isopeptide formation D2 family protein